MKRHATPDEMFPVLCLTSAASQLRWHHAELWQEFSLDKNRFVWAQDQLYAAWPLQLHKHLREVEHLHTRLREIGLGEQTVLSVLLLTVNNSLRCHPRRPQTHLKDIWMPKFRWKDNRSQGWQPVTTERNLISKEKTEKWVVVSFDPSAFENAFSTDMGAFLSIVTENEDVWVLFPHSHTTLTQKARPSFLMSPGEMSMAVIPTCCSSHISERFAQRPTSSAPV